MLFLGYLVCCIWLIVGLGRRHQCGRRCFRFTRLCQWSPFSWSFSWDGDGEGFASVSQDARSGGVSPYMPNLVRFGIFFMISESTSHLRHRQDHATKISHRPPVGFVPIMRAGKHLVLLSTRTS